MEASPATLVVIGASSRALAVSAARAGWRVYAADLFGDLDLREVAAGVACVRDQADGYPTGLVAAVRAFPPGPCCFVGALENHAEVLRAIAGDRTLLGSPPAAIAAVRDPRSLREIVLSAGLACPDCHPAPTGLPTDGSYLCKPLAGAAGRGIVPWTGGAAGPATAAHHWQRRIAGTPWSANYLVAADGGRLVGACRQVTGEPWCHAGPFAYCGSVAVPLDALPDELRRRLEALAPALADRGLRGAVGVDCMVDVEGTVWVIEVNPRPTASLELVERATGLSIAAAHVAACGGAVPAGGSPGAVAAGLRHAKAVVHAPRALSVDEPVVDRLRDLRREWSSSAACPGIADIPPPGVSVAVGGPLCTVFAAAPSTAAAIAALRGRVAVVLAAFSPPAGEASRPAARPGSIP
jgi:predicted ATP-grasp superfamily ATP-dependent carboligase